MTSCCGHGRKLCAFTKKKLETVRGAQKLLRVLTIGRGSARAEGWWWKETKESNMPQSCPECTKMVENGQFPTLIELKIIKNAGFYLKVLTRYTPEMFCEEYIIFKSFTSEDVYPVQSFGSHIRPQQLG